MRLLIILFLTFLSIRYLNFLLIYPFCKFCRIQALLNFISPHGYVSIRSDVHRLPRLRCRVPMHGYKFLLHTTLILISGKLHSSSSISSITSNLASTHFWPYGPNHKHAHHLLCKPRMPEHLLYSPTNVFNISSTNSGNMLRRIGGINLMFQIVRWVVAPNWMVAIYSFVWYWILYSLSSFTCTNNHYPCCQRIECTCMPTFISSLSSVGNMVLGMPYDLKRRPPNGLSNKVLLLL